MRNRCLTIAAALLLLPQLAAAQAQPAQTPAAGTVDVGGMFTTADGDEARFERYRDARDGAYTSLALNRETGSYLFNASASHIGYRDQRYAVEYSRPRLDFGFNWISLPLNYSYLTRTPYATSGATLTLPDSAQAAVQGPTNATNDGTAVGVPCAPGAPPASCTTATLAAAKANRSIYNTLADPFDLRHTRHTALFGVNYAATSALDLDAKFISRSITPSNCRSRSISAPTTCPSVRRGRIRREWCASAGMARGSTTATRCWCGTTRSG
jgi:hypothetical protein